jgi:cytochrome c nitrite reductase small subunit
MTNARIGKGKSYALVFGALAMTLAVFLMVGPPQLLAHSESPVFCASCHTMESQYEAWLHTGAHRRKSCVDCHLPNDNVATHYVWKSIDGMKDVVMQYTGLHAEEIKLGEHGAKVVQQNCIRCHGAAVEAIDQDRKCWDCHRRLMHKRSGAHATT